MAQQLRHKNLVITETQSASASQTAKPPSRKARDHFDLQPRRGRHGRSRRGEPSGRIPDKVVSVSQRYPGPDLRQCWVSIVAASAPQRIVTTAEHLSMITVSLGQRQLGEDAVYVLLDCAHRELAPIQRLCEFLPDRARRLRPLLGVRRRHPDVYDEQIRGVRSYQVEEFLGVAGLTGHGKAGALEKARRARTWSGDHMSQSSRGKPPCAAA
jgi:hypothetical protein